MRKISILLLEDTTADTAVLGGILDRSKKVSVSQVRDADAALAWLGGGNQCDVIFVHADSGRRYEQVIRRITDSSLALPLVFAADAPSVEDAVAAVRAGALDYLEPPFSESRVAAALEKAGCRSSASPRNAPQALRSARGCANIIGQSEKIQKVFLLIKKVCDTDTTVLVQGESGTGKELIAQALHYEGGRGRGPFVPVNCGAIPGELLESELFGHEKGAFTHAIRARAGRFELAHGGTVFLDEISEMSPMLQVKILRVLQERQFERIGGTRTITSDFRIIAATNRDLEEEVKKGTFREDLYYRLNVIPIEAPPLRERRADIPLLVDHFIKKFNHTKDKAITGVAPEALHYLLSYPWPGNVRELENVMERMVILSSGREIGVSDLPERLREKSGGSREEIDEIPAQGFFLSEVVADFEKKLILQALGQTNWVKNRAAKLLHVNRTTLIEKMKRFKLTRPPEERA